MKKVKYIGEYRVAELLGVSVSTVRRDRYSGLPVIPFVKSGLPGDKGRVWYDEAAVLAVKKARAEGGHNNNGR